MKTNFDVYTSFISPWTWKHLVSEGNYLPILAIRNIKNSNVIGHLSDTAVHFKELSPSNSLYQAKRDNEISLEDFHKRYLIELSGISIETIVERFNRLFEVSGARGLIIFGYGSNNEVCHRSTLASLLNLSGLFKNNITEFIL
jgi:uncharacterized protein YeaO (DUF488 family)